MLDNFKILFMFTCYIFKILFVIKIEVLSKGKLRNIIKNTIGK